MSSFDQQSADELKAKGTNEPEEPTEPAVDAEAFQPLYEFPPEQPLLDETPTPYAAPLPQELPGEQKSPTLPPNQPGLMYPPPPSYYQNLSMQPEQSSVSQVAPPMAAPVKGNQSAIPGSNASVPLRPVQPLPFNSQPPSPSYPPPVGYPPGMPPYAPPYGPNGQQPPVKKSHRWVWILVSVLSVLILASCGLCGWGAYTIFNSTYRQLSGAINVVDDFYSNLQAANYSAAYSDLAPQGQIIGLTKTQFTTQASQFDTRYGPVTSFVLGQPSYTTNSGTGPDLSQFTITVSVKRTHLSYTALLTVKQIGNTWKIIEYDRL